MTRLLLFLIRLIQTICMRGTIGYLACHVAFLRVHRNMLRKEIRRLMFMSQRRPKVKIEIED